MPYLEPHEFVAALAQRFGGTNAFGLDQCVQALAQISLGDADEAPRLHQPHAGRLMRRRQQPLSHLGINRAGAEVAHVASLADRAIDCVAFVRTEGIGAHRA